MRISTLGIKGDPSLLLYVRSRFAARSLPAPEGGGERAGGHGDIRDMGMGMGIHGGSSRNLRLGLDRPREAARRCWGGRMEGQDGTSIPPAAMLPVAGPGGGVAAAAAALTWPKAQQRQEQRGQPGSSPGPFPLHSSSSSSSSVLCGSGSSVSGRRDGEERSRRSPQPVGSPSCSWQGTASSLISWPSSLISSPKHWGQPRGPAALGDAQRGEVR